MALEVAEGGNPLKFSAVVDFSEAMKSVDSFYKRLSDKAKGYKVDTTTVDDVTERVKAQTEVTANQKAILNGLSAQYRTLMKDALSAFSGIDEGLKNNYAKLASYQQNLSKLSASQRELAKSFKDGSITQKQYLEGTRALQVQQNAYKQRVSEVVKQIKQQEQTEKNAIGSIAEKTAKLTQLRAEYNRLSEAQRQNANVGGKIVADYQRISKEVEGLNRGLKGTSSASTGVSSVLSQVKVLGGALGITFGVTQLMAFAGELFQIAKQAEGVTLAFQRMSKDSTKDLSMLREATKGTVSDLELMKLAVRADNFSIPMDVLAKGLSFARQRANDTGQSVDYLVNSFVDGLGRQSKLILDNLGISAKELSEEIERVGDFATATGNIIERNTLSAGAQVDTFADKVNRMGAWWDNSKLKMSRFFAGLSIEIADLVSSDSWGEFWERFTNFGKGDFISMGDKLRAQYKDISKGVGSQEFGFDGAKSRLENGLIDYKTEEQKALNHYKDMQKITAQYRDQVKRGIYDERDVSVKMFEELEAKAKYNLGAISLAGRQLGKNVSDSIKPITQVSLSIADMNKQIKDLNEKIENETDPAKVKAMSAQVKAIERKIKSLRGEEVKTTKTDAERQADQKAKQLATQIKADEKAFERLIEQGASLSKRFTGEIYTRQQQEIVNVREAYSELIKEAEKYNKTTKADKKIDIKNLENERDISVKNIETKQRKEAELEADKKRKERVDKIIADNLTANQKLEKIESDYHKAIADLGEKLTTELKNQLDQRKQAEIKAVSEAETEKRLLITKGAKYWLSVTTASVHEQIKLIESMLSNNSILGAVRTNLENELNKLKEVAKNGAKVTAFTALQQESILLTEELNKLESQGIKTGSVHADLSERLRENQDAMNKLTAKGLKGFLSDMQKARALTSAYADMLFDVGEGIEKLGISTKNSFLSDVGGLLSGLAKNLDDVVTVFDESLTKTEKYALAVKSVVSMLNLVADASAQRREAEQAFYEDMIGLQNDYNLSLTQQIRLQAQLSENAFITDYTGRLKGGIEATQKATDDLNKAFNKLFETGKVKDGQRNAVDWKSVGSGAVSGATLGGAIGSIVPLIGTAIGSAVGAVIGGIVGLFGGKKKKDTYTSLMSQYPEFKAILDSTDTNSDVKLEVLSKLAQDLIKNNIADDQTKKQLENIQALISELKQAKDQIRSTVKELSGNIGDDLKNSLVEAFRAGEEGALAMGKTLNKVLEDMLSQLLFNRVFNDIFTDLEEKLTDGILESAMNGDESGLIDVMAEFYDKASPAVKTFNESLALFKELGKNKGFDLFEKEKQDEKTGSLSKGIAGITETTANRLEGEFGGLRIAQLQLLEVSKSNHTQIVTISAKQINELVLIQQNTLRTAKNTDRLEAIETVLVSLNSKVSNSDAIKRGAGL